MSASKVVKTTERVKSQKIINQPKARGLLGGLFGGALLGGAAASNAGGGKVKRLTSSIQGVGCGIFLLVVGLVLTYFSVIAVKEHSKVVGALPLLKSTQVTKNIGMSKFTGKPTVTTELQYEYRLCALEGCTTPANQLKAVGGLLYYTATLERYEQSEKTRTETRARVENGVEIEEEVEITDVVEDWETKQTDEAWAGFDLGKIKVDGESADNMLDLDEDIIEDVYIPDLAGDSVYVPGALAEASSQVGDTRLVLRTAKVTDDLIVVGEVSGGKVSTGEPFIVTNHTNAKLIEELEAKESLSRWLLRGSAWLALTLGIMMVLGPILAVLDFVPLVGNLANGVAFVIGAILSALVVFVGTLIITYWWVFALFLVLIVVGAIVLVSNRTGDAKSSKK